MKQSLLYDTIKIDIKRKIINVVIEDWTRKNGVNLYIVTGNGYEIKRNSGNVTLGYLTAKYNAPASEEIVIPENEKYAFLEKLWDS